VNVTTDDDIELLMPYHDIDIGLAVIEFAFGTVGSRPELVPIIKERQATRKWTRRDTLALLDAQEMARMNNIAAANQYSPGAEIQFVIACNGLAALQGLRRGTYNKMYPVQKQPFFKMVQPPKLVPLIQPPKLIANEQAANTNRNKIKNAVKNSSKKEVKTGTHKKAKTAPTISATQIPSRKKKRPKIILDDEIPELIEQENNEIKQ